MFRPTSLRKEGFVLRPGREPASNRVFAEVIYRPPTLLGKSTAIFRSFPDEENLLNLINSEPYIERTTRGILESIAGGYVPADRFSPVDTLIDHMRRMHIPTQKTRRLPVPESPERVPESSRPPPPPPPPPRPQPPSDAWALRNEPLSAKGWSDVVQCGFAAAYDAYNGGSYNRTFGDALAADVPLVVRRVVESVANTEPYEGLTVGQLVLLNRLHQSSYLAERSGVADESQRRTRWLGRIRSIGTLDRRRTLAFIGEMYERVPFVHEGHADWEDRETLTLLQKLVDEREDLNASQRGFIAYLVEAIADHRRCRFTRLDCRRSLARLKSAFDSASELIFFLAQAFPTTAYSRFFNVREEGALAFVSLNVPLSVRYAILSGFDPELCSFRAPDLTAFAHHPYLQQRLEYAIYAPLAEAFEGSAEYVAHVRKHYVFLHAYACSPDDVPIGRLQALRSAGFNAAAYPAAVLRAKLGRENPPKEGDDLFGAPDEILQEGPSWKLDGPVLTEYRGHLNALQSTLLTDFWGFRYGDQDPRDLLADLPKLWRRLPRARLDTFSIDPRAATSYSTTGPRLGPNAGTDLRGNIYVASSLIDALVGGRDESFSDSAGFRRSSELLPSPADLLAEDTRL